MEWEENEIVEVSKMLEKAKEKLQSANDAWLDRENNKDISEKKVMEVYLSLTVSFQVIEEAIIVLTSKICDNVYSKYTLKEIKEASLHNL